MTCLQLRIPPGAPLSRLYCSCACSSRARRMRVLGIPVDVPRGAGPATVYAAKLRAARAAAVDLVVRGEVA